MPANIIDLRLLDPETRNKIERIITPQDTMMTCKFNPDDIELWRQKAGREGLDLTTWIRNALNDSVANPIARKHEEYDSGLRTVQLSRRFNSNECSRWRLAIPKKESITSWMERSLNRAAGKKGHK